VSSQMGAPEAMHAEGRRRHWMAFVPLLSIKNPNSQARRPQEERRSEGARQHVAPPTTNSTEIQPLRFTRQNSNGLLWLMRPTGV
jgi:hypothetical protein